MRNVLIFALFSLAILAAPAAGVVIDPSRCGVGLSAPSVNPPCQYRFRIDGGLDNLVVQVTVRDVFDNPVDHCPVTGTLRSAGASTLAFCTPCNDRTELTNAFGVTSMSFRKIGGRGRLELTLTEQFSFVQVGARTIDFTTPDLNARKGAGPGSGCEGPCLGPPSPQVTDVIDLGVWASGLPPDYKQPSDYLCTGLDTSLEVLTSLAVWANGIGRCFDGVCP